MLPEIKAIEPQLKQILYGCVEFVQATKAALYLSASENVNEKKFELVTSYQYNVSDRKVISSADDLVDRLAVKRNAFFVNGLNADQRLAEMLFRQGNDRLLATPIFSRGRMVGFIDMRDKAGKKPFETSDLEAARRIAEEMLGALSAKNLFGLAAVPLVELSSGGAKTAEPATAPPPAPEERPPQVPLRGEVFTPAARQAIDSARQFMSKRQHAAVPTGRRAITEGDLDVVRLLLPAVLSIPGAVLASFTALAHLTNPLSMVAMATVTDDALEMFEAHLQSWLQRSDQHLPQARPQVMYPFGVQVVPVTAAGISSVISAPVNPQSIDGLVLTVAFERTPEAQAQRALQIFLRQIEPSVESALSATAGRSDKLAVAERLLEPDFARMPELAGHCREVSAIATRFAHLLELPPLQIETVRVAALVHDVGMRLLDYDRLYRRPNLTAEEIRGLGEHPIVGAALVESVLGPDVAQAVLRHHERVDGKGYPSRMTGNQIPIAARIIQICDAWVAMTSRHSYQPPVGPQEAAKRLRDGAGTQFDAALVGKFLNSLDQIANG